MKSIHAISTSTRSVPHTTVQWQEAVQGAANEIARRALGFSGAEVSEPISLYQSAGMVGAHIPLVGNPSYELSLVATRPNCSKLATAILGMNAEELPAGTIPDAIGEIVNMLAGGVKRRLAASGGDLELGLPVFVNGTVEPSGTQSVLAFAAQLGSLSVMVLILGPKN